MVIAIDFDGTLCSYPCSTGKCWPFPGDPKLIHRLLLKWLIRRQKAGDSIIIWSCREGIAETVAKRWLSERGLIPDKWNEGLFEDTNNVLSRKISFDLLIDDKQIGLIGWLLRRSAARHSR